MTAPARDLFGGWVEEALVAVPVPRVRRAALALHLSTVRIDLVREQTSTLARSARKSADVAEVLRGIFATLDADVEAFVVLALDAKNRPSGFKVVSTGTATSSLVHPRHVFTAALALGAHSIILAHNHPSGEAEPSPEDLDITRRLCAVGELLGVKVADHLVLGSDTLYVSFLDCGFLP